MAFKNIDDISDKIRDLEGQQKITIEFVLDYDDGNSGNGRIFVINIGTSNPEIGICADEMGKFYFFWERGYCRTWYGATTRTIFHIVIDTTQGVENDRVKIYENGILAVIDSYDSNPVQNDTFNFGANASLYMFNRAGGGRAIDGIIFYAALYSSAFSQADVTNNHDILIEDDD
jgi:hypothetical protein